MHSSREKTEGEYVMCVACCVLRVACCVLRVACCVLRVEYSGCVLRVE